MKGSSEFRCSTCGQNFRASAWSALPTLRVLTSAEVHEHVTAWPEETLVAVRECSACGSPMARTVRKPQQRGEGVWP